jgi:hypothetical protein
LGEESRQLPDSPFGEHEDKILSLIIF